MSNTYYLVNNSNEINLKVKVGTRGNAGTVIKKWRSGNSVVTILKSDPNSNGNISNHVIGIASQLIGSTLTIDTAILLDGFSDSEIDQEFTNVFMEITMQGGLDGEQKYYVDKNEKKEYKGQKLIVITKAIKLKTQTV